MHNKTQIRLIKTHTEGTRRNKSLHPVFLERLLCNQPLIRVSFTGVSKHLVAAGTQSICGIFCRRDSQRVDNARTGQAVQVREQPTDALRLMGQGQNAQAQGLAGQRTTQHMHGCGGIGAELFGDIAANAVIRGCGSRQHRHTHRQRSNERTNTAVVGAEVMAPVRNTVRLINDEQTQARQQVRQPLLTERRVIEAFGAHQEHIKLVSFEAGTDFIPFGDVRGVHHGGTHSRAGCRLNLITHEGKQRGDDKSRAHTAGTQQQGRNKVDRRLTPAGTLHDEGAGAVGYEGANRLILAVVELGISDAGEAAQHFTGFSMQEIGGAGRWLFGVHGSLQRWVVGAIATPRRAVLSFHHVTPRILRLCGWSFLGEARERRITSGCLAAMVGRFTPRSPVHPA